MNYNQSQQTAILHKDGPMLVLAGPGSGKTAVITQRTIQLIKEYNVDSANILVITFTKAAANEMKQRFLRQMGVAKTPVTFGTFHAVFFMVLKYAYGFSGSNIVAEEQRYQFMREIISYYHLEYRDENEFIGDILGEISMVKNMKQMRSFWQPGAYHMRRRVQPEKEYSCLKNADMLSQNYIRHWFRWKQKRHGAGI